jgi:hypothetical protein
MNAGQSAIKKSPGRALVMVGFNAAAMFDVPGRRHYTTRCKNCHRRLGCRLDACAYCPQNRNGKVINMKILPWITHLAMALRQQLIPKVLERLFSSPAHLP